MLENSTIFTSPHNLIEDLEPHNKKRIIYIGNNRKKLHEEFISFNYEVISFNLSFPADIWLKYNALSISQLPDAIICDLELPDTNAFSLYESLKSNSRLNSIPFIVISENFNSLDKIKAYELGIDDFYPVDVTIADLHERISILKEIKGENVKVYPKNRIPIIDNKLIIEKRLFDIVVSSLLILLLLPVFILITLLIMLESRGPVFYISQRVGTGYQIFNFYKFRTMKVGADNELQKLLHLNQYKRDGKGSSFIKIDNDPRITRIGRFLRQTSLDELPQLINVLLGDMSLVGNRPLPLYEAEKLTTDMWAKRFLAPAGITGLWQVTKRGGRDMSEEERIDLDVAYADRASFWFDVMILFRTLPAVIQKASV